MGKRSCAACGAPGPLEGEHVVPEWVGPFLRDVMKEGGRGRVTHTWRPGSRSSTGPREFTTDSPQLVASAVCNGCNTGWMSDLEVQTKPILSRLIMGQRATLTVDEQEVLATWAVKTALTFQLARSAPDRDIDPARVLPELRRRGRPPLGCYVRLAATHNGPAVWEQATRSVLQSSKPVTETPALCTAMAFGHALLVVDIPTNLTRIPPALLTAKSRSPFPYIWLPQGPQKWPTIAVNGPDLDVKALAEARS